VRIFMTRIQVIILIAIVAAIAAIAGPRAIKMSRISRAEHQVLAIANGFAVYRSDTGQECTKIEDLIENPGVDGWMGPYIQRESLQNPWGGTYGAESEQVGIPKGDKAPDEYELGGSEEISFSFSVLQSTLAPLK
jgi:type II secretory pathway pseudopilin PulG